MDAMQVSGSIIVGVEDSDGSRAAIRWAAKTAREHRWPLTLVHAYVDREHPGVRGLMPPELDLRAEATGLMDRAEMYLRSTGWPADAPARIVEPARPRDLLTELAPETRMVVVGRRGTGGFRDMLIGSTAYGVAERCNVPVVIVPEGWDESTPTDKPVVVGLDQDSGDAALEFAFDFASRTSSRLQATHVVPPPVYLAFGGYGGYWPATEGWTEARGDDLEQQRLYLAEQLAGWREKYPDVQLESIVARGFPAGALLGTCSRAGLLVVGGKDHGVLASTVIGSVARNLMHHATCPLAVVHDAR